MDVCRLGANFDDLVISANLRRKLFRGGGRGVGSGEGGEFEVVEGRGFIDIFPSHWS